MQNIGQQRTPLKQTTADGASTTATATHPYLQKTIEWQREHVHRHRDNTLTQQRGNNFSSSSTDGELLFSVLRTEDPSAHTEEPGDKPRTSSRTPTSRRFNSRYGVGLLQNLRQQNAPIHAGMTQNQFANNSRKKNKELTQQLHTSNIEIGCLHSEAFGLRMSLGRRRSTQNPDA